MKLKGKVAIVTGASSGIGKEISLELAKQKVKVALLARRKNKLEEVKKQIGNFKGSSIVVPTDVTSELQIKNSIETIINNYNQIDILVNNAGLGIFKEVQNLSVEEWDKQINVMLRGTFLMTKFSLPYIYKQKRGHIVNISSLWAKKFCATCSAYTAAKFGIRGFTQSLRKEARKKNVKVTNIMPGTVDTPFFEKSNWKTDLDKALKPKDIAKTITFILKLPDRAVVEKIILQALKTKNVC